MCRQQQRLRQCGVKDDELERKEKGFMLYVNGANAAVAVPSSSKTARTARPKSCHKTISDCKPHAVFSDFCLCREKGFMLYVNGANAAVAVPSSSKTARTARPKSCHKTISDCKTHAVFSDFYLH